MAAIPLFGVIAGDAVLERVSLSKFIGSSRVFFWILDDSIGVLIADIPDFKAVEWCSEVPIDKSATDFKPAESSSCGLISTWTDMSA